VHFGDEEIKFCNIYNWLDLTPLSEPLPLKETLNPGNLVRIYTFSLLLTNGPNKLEGTGWLFESCLMFLCKDRAYPRVEHPRGASLW